MSWNTIREILQLGRSEDFKSAARTVLVATLLRNSRRTLKSSCLALVLLYCCTFVYAAPFEMCDLGPVSVMRPDPADWSSDENLEINHQGIFVHQKSQDRLTLSFYAPTNFERKYGIIHFVRKNFESDFENEGWHTFIHYRYLANCDLVLIARLQTKSSEVTQSPGFEYFRDWIRNVHINSDYPFSPCVRLGMIKDQFQKLSEAKHHAGDLRGLASYAANLKAELENRIALNERHCFRPLHDLLRYLANVKF